MTSDDAKKAYPQLDCTPSSSGIKKISCEYQGREDNFMAKTNVGITDKPWGGGVYYIQLERNIEKVDPPVFLKQFEEDLTAKFGKPDQKTPEPFKAYSFCWGTSGKECGAAIVLPLENLAGKLSKGKKLIARFKQGKSYDTVEFLLCDMAPAYLYKEKQNQETQKKSKQKIVF
jgi:hypothetical protein